MFKKISIVLLGIVCFGLGTSYSYYTFATSDQNINDIDKQVGLRLPLKDTSTLNLNSRFSNLTVNNVQPNDNVEFINEFKTQPYHYSEDDCTIDNHYINGVHIHDIENCTDPYHNHHNNGYNDYNNSRNYNNNNLGHHNGYRGRHH